MTDWVEVMWLIVIYLELRQIKISVKGKNDSKQ